MIAINIHIKVILNIGEWVKIVYTLLLFETFNKHYFIFVNSSISFYSSFKDSLINECLTSKW